MIMRRGEVVESGAARAVLDNPQHPYSQLLKSSVLSPDIPPLGADPHA
jgi:peptide/nickel transport system ATP-binding protein